jgi:3,4-dihydroxy 2-butanone 4-phosphate synthase / GTP cyclohydrolase II
MEFQLDSIEDAIEVVDDENRENEGDFLTAAENVTPEIINFMATHGRGLICAPLIESRCDELGLDLMVQNNSAQFETPFTVSVDVIGHGTTTGISASDRFETVKALTNPNTQPNELGKPGHIFPLRAKAGGVLRRAGHTEAAIDFARLAGFNAAGLIVEILNDDGSMARLPQLIEIAKRFKLKLVSIEDLINYRLRHESLIEKLVEVDMPTKHGHFKLAAFKQTTSGEEHLAITKGNWTEDEDILVRVHSSCFTGDILDSLRCDCGSQLANALDQIEKEGKGVVLYMNQEGRGIGLVNKLKAYKLQEEGYDTVEANIKLGFQADQRDYGIGAQILRSLGVRKMRLMTNNPKKRTGLIGYGLKIVENVAIEVSHNEHNEAYLKTKKDKLGHTLKMGK